MGRREGKLSIMLGTYLSYFLRARYVPSQKPVDTIETISCRPDDIRHREAREPIHALLPGRQTFTSAGVLVEEFHLFGG